MSAQDDDKNKGAGAGKNPNDDDGARKIKVTVDTEQMKQIMKRLTEEEEKSKKLQSDLDAALEAKKTAETSLEEEKTTREDYESKLKLIAEEKLNAKRKIILEKAKEIIKDEERLKKIESGMKTAEDIKATEFMMETLSKSLEEGEKQHKELLAKQSFDSTKATLLSRFPDAKAKIEELEKAEDKDIVKKSEELATLQKELETAAGAGAGAGTGDKSGGDKKGAAGQAKLGPAQTGGGAVTGYDSHQAMVYDLRKRSHSDNPEEAAEAQAILDELFRKWSIAVKKQYEGKVPPVEITSEGQPTVADITKRGGAARPTKPFKEEESE